MGTGPSLWQAPNYGIPCPKHIRQSGSVDIFKTALKTYYFKKAYSCEFYCSKETCFYVLKYGPVFVHINVYLIYSLCF